MHVQVRRSQLDLYLYKRWNAFLKRIANAKKFIDGFPSRPSLKFGTNEMGRFAIPSHPANDKIANKIQAGVIFEPEIVEVAQRYIMPGSVVIDVGANFGQMSILFAHETGPSGVVYSIEADDYICRILETNVKLNNISNIIILAGR